MWDRGITLRKTHVPTAQHLPAMLLLLLTLQSLFVACQGQFNLQMLRQHMNAGRAFPQQLLNNRFQNFNSQHLRSQNGAVNAQQRFQIPNLAANASPQINSMQPGFPGSPAQVSSQINRSWQQQPIQSAGVQSNPMQQPPSSQNVPNTRPSADPNLVQKQIHEFHRLQVMLRHIQQQRQRQQEQQRRQQQQQQEQQRRQQLLQRIQAIQRARAQGVTAQTGGSGHSAKINQMEKMIRDMIKYRDQLKQEAAFRQKTRQVDATNLLHREDVQSGPSLLVMDKDMVTAVPVVTTSKPNGSLGQSMIVFAKTANIHSNVESQNNNAGEQAKPDPIPQTTTTTTTTTTPKPVVYQNPGFQQLGIQHPLPKMPHEHQIELPQQQNLHRTSTQVHQPTHQQHQNALPANNNPALLQNNMIASNGRVNSLQPNTHRHQQNNQAWDKPTNHHGNPSLRTNSQHPEPVMRESANQNHRSPHVNQHPPTNHVQSNRPTQMELPPLGTVQQNSHMFLERTDPPPVQLPTLNMLSVDNQQPILLPVQQHSSRKSPVQSQGSNNPQPAHRSIPSPNNHMQTFISTEPPSQWKQARQTTTPIPDVPKMHSHGSMQTPVINRRLLKRPPRPRIITTTPEPLFHQNSLPHHSRVHMGAVQHEVQTVPPVVTEPPHRFVPTSPPNTTPKPSINDMFNRMSRPRPQKVRISFRKQAPLGGSLGGGVPPLQITTPSFPPTPLPFIPTQSKNQPEPTTTPVIPTQPNFPPVHQELPQYHKPVEQFPSLPPPLPTAEQVQNFQMNAHHQYPIRHHRVTTEPSIMYYTTTESSYHHQERTHQSEQIVPVPFSHPLHGFNQNQNTHINSYIPPTTTTTQAPLHLSNLQKWEAEMKINSRTHVAGVHPNNNGAIHTHHQVTTTEAPRVHPPAPKRAENPLAKLLKLLQRKNASIKFASDRKNQQQFKDSRPQQQTQTTTTERPLMRVPAPQPQNSAPFSRHSSGSVPRHTQVPHTSHWSHHRAPTAAPSTNLQSARNNFRRFEMSPFSTSLPLNNHKTRLQPTAIPIVQPPSQTQLSNSRGNRIPTEQSSLRHRHIQHTRHRVRENVRLQPQRVNVGTKSPGPVNPAQLLIAALIQALQSGNLLKQLQRHQQQSTQFQHQPVQESEPVMPHTQMNSPAHYNEQQSQPTMHMEEQRQLDVPYYNMEENHVQQHQHIPQQVDRQPRFENQNNNHHQVIRYNAETQTKPPKHMPDLSMLQGQDVEFTDVNTGFGGESPPPVIIQRIPKNSRSRSNGNSVSYELPSMALHENSAVVIDTSTGDDSNSTSDNTEEKKNSTDDNDMDLPKLSTIFASKITTKSPPSSTTPETIVESIKLPALDTEKTEDKQEENVKLGVFKNADANDQENGKSFNFQLPSLSPINLDYETNEVSTPPPLFAMTKNVKKNENDKDDLTTTPSITRKPTTTEKTTSTTVKDVSTVAPDRSTTSVVPTTSMSKTTTILKIDDDSYDKTPKTTTAATTTTRKITTSTTPSTTTTANAPTATPTSTSTPTTMIPTTTTTSTPTSTTVEPAMSSTTTTTTTTMLPTTTTTQSTTTQPITQMKTTTLEYNTISDMTTVTPTLPRKEKDEEKEYEVKASTTTSTTIPTPKTSTIKQKTQQTTTTVYATSPFFFMTTMDYRALYPELFGLRPLMHEPVEPSTSTDFTTTTTPITTSTRSTTAASITTFRPTTTTTFKPTAIETTPKPTTTTYKTTTTLRDIPTTTTPKPMRITPAWQPRTTHFTTDVFPFTLPTTIDYRDLFAEMFGRKPVPGIFGAQESSLEQKPHPETTMSPVTTTAAKTTTFLPPAPKKTAYVGLSLENFREHRKATNISPTVLSNTVENTLPLLSLPSPTVRDIPRSFVSDNLNGGHGLQPQTVRPTTPRSIRILGRDIVVQTTAQSFAANHLSGHQGVNDQPANHISDFVQNGNAGSLSQQRIIHRQMSVPETMSNVLSPQPTPHVDVVDIPYDPHLDRAATLLSGNRIPDQFTDPKVAGASEAPTESSGSANEPLNVIDLNAFSTNSLAANPNVEHSQQSNPLNGVADVSTQLDSLLSALGSDIMIHEQKSSDGHVQYKIHGGNKDLPAFVLRTGYKWADTFG